jgi:glycosyltransferase involved in cell wall biosynthesis
LRIVIDLEAAQSPSSRNRGIGRYSTSLAKAMLRQRGDHEIVIALNGMYADSVGPLRESFEGLLPQNDIVTWHAAVPPRSISTPGLRPAFEALREAFFASLDADVVHVASVFEFGPYSCPTIGRGPGRHRTAVTLYDLIPHLNREVYLHRPEVARDYDGGLAQLKRADLWLAISESSRREGVEHLGLPDDRAVNISSAIDGHFAPGDVPADRDVQLRVHYGLWRPYVMYTGGIDPRKNVEGLIEAWARLPEGLRRAHQLAIVCSVQPDERARLEQLADSVGLGSGELVLTGFVPEGDLVDLYRLAKLFVFPSMHEGFGLPALEAMSCGTATIGADNSSIPEVIGRADALFDARSREAIAAKIQQCLLDDEFRADLARHGLEQAKCFSWDHSARTALDAIEALGPAPAQARPSAASRPRLAYVAPLPPQRSGIADYSAELLPALARHYEIDAVVDQPEVEPTVVASVAAVRDAQWFLEHGQEYDRILYHFGNSNFHEYMLPLLARHPGTVVLHDFYLSGMQAHRELITERQPHWSRALYESHGWDALAQRARAGDLTGVIHEFPANFEVLRDAHGVVVHSPHSRVLARRWYGPHAGDDWRVIPHLRVPLPREREKARAELGLAPDDFLVCSFGIMGPTKLNARLLRAWRRSSLAADPHCHLVFVGENDPVDYGREIASTLRSLPGGRARITGWASPEVFRRYLNAADLAVQLRTLSRGETSGTVLDAMNHGVPVVANANGTMAFLPREAVHLLEDEFDDEDLVRALETLRADAGLRRNMSEAGRRIIETQHSPADCAAAYADAIEEFAWRARTSAATVARTIARELPPGSDDFLVGSIARAIALDLPAPAPARQLFVDVSRQVASQEPLPPLLEGLLAESYPGWRAEPVYRAPDGHWRYARRFMLHRLPCPPQLLDDDLAEFRREDVWCFLQDEAQPALPPEVFEAGLETITLPANIDVAMAWPRIAETTRHWGVRRCWVDISELVRYDWQSGIQRVVKNYLLNLLRHPPAGQTVLPVYATTQEYGYRVARRFLNEALGLAPPPADERDPAIDPQPGDTFFGLDLQPHLVPVHEAYFRELRRRGVRVAFMVYDLLPIRLPDCFHADAAQHHTRWLEVVAQSELAICISGAVAHDLRDWLAEHRPQGAMPEIRHVHLGADIGSRIATRGLPPEADSLLERMRERPSFLMVGTIEPRKAHAAVLAAFEQLWAQGADCTLVISGRPGWMADELMARLRSHPESGQRLLWIADASDEFLEAIYRACAALILASRGEGFGLPLVEAAQRELPLIARDLPVFREVAGEHAWYFGDDSPQGLADSIRAWLDSYAKGEHPRPQGMRWLTWEQSAAQLRALLDPLSLTS